MLQTLNLGPSDWQYKYRQSPQPVRSNATIAGSTCCKAEPSYNVHIKSGVSSFPLRLWGADDVEQREGVVETVHLREVQMSVIDVVVDSYEHLAFASINYCIVLERKGVGQRVALSTPHVT